jgi:hypothetical protein
MTMSGQPQGLEAPKKSSEVIRGRYRAAVEILDNRGQRVTLLHADPITGNMSSGFSIIEAIRDNCQSPKTNTFRWTEDYRRAAGDKVHQLMMQHPDTYVDRTTDGVALPENRFPAMIG